MNLARHSITSTNPIIVLDARFDADCQIFTSSTPAGFAVYQTWPLKLLRKRGALFNTDHAMVAHSFASELTGGTLSAVIPLHTSSLLFLIGGGRSPLYPPNKVILWDDAICKEVAELEFREKVRGLACRRGWFAVALRRRVVVFELGELVTRHGEWDTCDNPRGQLVFFSLHDVNVFNLVVRFVSHGYRSLLNTLGYPGPSNGTCSIVTSPSL
jgi:WD repeat-containing protein 45